jgi:hypothetical protein
VRLFVLWSRRLDDKSADGAPAVTSAAGCVKGELSVSREARACLHRRVVEREVALEAWLLGEAHVARRDVPSSSGWTICSTNRRRLASAASAFAPIADLSPAMAGSVLVPIRTVCRHAVAPSGAIRRPFAGPRSAL